MYIIYQICFRISIFIVLDCLIRSHFCCMITNSSFLNNQKMIHINRYRYEYVCVYIYQEYRILFILIIVPKTYVFVSVYLCIACSENIKYNHTILHYSIYKTSNQESNRFIILKGFKTR